MKAFVTGGGGFLGGAIVKLLRERGDDVVSYSRRTHAAIESAGARCVPGEIDDRARLAAAMRGSDVVFHVAARAGIHGPRAEYERVNVEGTRAVIAAAIECGVASLVHTSSPSVCFDGADHVNASNDLPHAARFLAEYPRSKAIAEKLVLAAHGRRGLSTCALRPHLVFGPGDPHLVPRILARARAGKLARVGDGTNRVSLTYVDNAAHAHLDAADRLGPAAAHGGRAYFVAQAESVVLWPWIDGLLARHGIPPVEKRLSFSAAYVLGRVSEIAWETLRRTDAPPMTRFLALQLARTHTYDLGPARHDFGYVERFDLGQAMEHSFADESVERPVVSGSRG